MGLLLDNTGSAKQQVAYLTTLLALALLVLLLIMSAATAGAQSQKVATVSIRDFYFEPSQLVIEPGTTVQWVNEGTTQHTVFATSPAGTFLSGTLKPGESFTYTFPQRFPRPSPDRSTVQPGMFRYICKIHPEMKGSVVFGEPQREATTVEQPPATVPQPPTTLPKTGGLSPILLISLAVIVAVGLLGWAIKRRSS
jgi:LPXTG-motif cell wall-anchored protein